MFDFIKKTKSKQATAAEYMTRFGLERKPFARALLGRTSHDFDESYKLLTGIARSHLQVVHGKDLTEFAESSATMCANSLTHDALEAIGYKPAISLSEPVPSHAPLAFSFASFVILGVVDDLRQEGIPVDFVRMCAGHAQTLLMGRPEAESKEHFQEFGSKFQRLWLTTRNR